jgi:hypothetical protein
LNNGPWNFIGWWIIGSHIGQLIHRYWRWGLAIFILYYITHVHIPL